MSEETANVRDVVESRVARYLLLRHFAQTGGSSTIRIIDSGSMAPLVNGGEMTAEVEWGRLDKLRLGELVVVAIPPVDLLVVHRSVAWRRRRGTRELLQLPDSDDGGGSGMPGRFVPLPPGYESPWVGECNVLGRVTCLVSRDGRVPYDIRSPLTRLTNVVARSFGRRIWRWSEQGAVRREWIARRLRRVTLLCLVALSSRPHRVDVAPIASLDPGGSR